VNEIDRASSVSGAQCTYSQRRCRREIVLFATIERVESGLHVRVTRDIQNAGSSQITVRDQIVIYVRIRSVQRHSRPFADMLKLVVFSEYIPELVFAVNEIDGAATVPFPARNVPIVSVDAARLSCFPPVYLAVCTLE
jgi:hypothetical protein